MERLYCLAAGYLCGIFLTADLVARLRTGNSAGNLGSGNPGMANVASQLGVLWGAAVLAGDVLKTALACFFARLVLAPELGALAVLYAGLGAALGHNFPFWRGFQGGKGVAVTCTFLILASPLWGILSCLAGLAAVALTGFLPLGAVVIPAAFLAPAFLSLGGEAGFLALLAALLMLSRHIHGLVRVGRGEEAKVWRKGSPTGERRHRMG